MVWQGLCIMLGRHDGGLVVAGLACHVRVVPCQGLCAAGQHGSGVAWLWQWW